MKIVLTGATGLIGSRFEELMFENHEIIPLSSSRATDITDINSVEAFLQNKEFDVIIHFAGKTDVDGCEKDKVQDLNDLGMDGDEVLNIDLSKINYSLWKNKKTAFAINSAGTMNLYSIAKKNDKKFVYISTDFVFSGEEDSNHENSIPNPVNWYGMTKYIGEKVIDNEKDLIVRLSYPYGYQSAVKKDFVWKITDLLTCRDEVDLVSDQTITPTFIDDIVEGLLFILNKNEKGIFHLTGSSYEKPIEIGQKIKSLYGLKTNLGKTNLETLYKGKAPRPFQSIMKNDRLVNLGFIPKSFGEGLDLIKNI